MSYSLKLGGLAFFADGVLDSGKAGVALSEGQTFRALLDQSLQRTTLNGLRTNGRHMPLPEMGSVDAEFDLRALNILAQRQQLIAANIANADTPNYKAKDLDWRAAMLEASQYRPSSLEMIGGAKAHIAARAEDQGQDLKHKYRVSSQGSVDGNTVEVDVERVQFAENTLRFKFALQMASEEASEIGWMLRSIAR